MSVSPLNEEITNTSVPWVQWFTETSDTLSPPNRDSGSFTPVFVGLSTTPTISFTGNFVRNGEMLFFQNMTKRVIPIQNMNLQKSLQ